MQLLARTQEILGELISFPTVSADSNLELIAYAADLLSEAGAALSISRDETGAKANLFATLGPHVDGGIVLSGHTDVVPVDDQEWTGDPFVMDERGGLLYGRDSYETSSREDERVTASAGLVYQFSRYIAFVADIVHDRVNSSAPGQSDNVTEATAGFRLRY